MSEQMTIPQIKKLFENTVFWNWMNPVDAAALDDPEKRDSEYFLRIYPNNDDPDVRELHLYFESGETSIHVATVHVNTSMVDSTATEDDAVFLKSLPVAIPALFRRIKDLENVIAVLLDTTPRTPEVERMVRAAAKNVLEDDQ